jgi:DNA-binding CsgD family transcriptional regulator
MEAIGDAKHALPAAAATLDQLRIGTAWVTASAMLLYMNAAMRRILLANATTIRIQASQLGLSGRYQAILLGALGRAEDRRGTLIRVLPPGGNALSLYVSPVPETEYSEELPDAAAIIYVLEPPMFPDPLIGSLKETYGLTKSEARILQHLLNGATPLSIAAALGTSINTVRTQIKNILAKCGASRQMELIRIAAEMPQVLFAGLT